MLLQFGLTDELTNSQIAPVATLAAYYQAENVLKPLQSVIPSSDQDEFSLANKLTQLILSILTGCEYVSMDNTRLRPERTMGQLYRNEGFVDQSTLSKALNGLTQMNLTQLEQAVQQISTGCSRTRDHDWRGFLLLDFDLSGMPCGKQAQKGSKGYFSGKKMHLVGN